MSLERPLVSAGRMCWGVAGVPLTGDVPAHDEKEEEGLRLGVKNNLVTAQTWGGRRVRGDRVVLWAQLVAHRVRSGCD